jgi:hypothetical protein
MIYINNTLTNAMNTVQNIHPQQFYHIDYSIYQSQTVSHFIVINVTCFFMIYILDSLLKKVNCKARWFTLHAITNFIIAVTTFTDVLECIANPLVSSHPMTISIAGNIACTLHIYHCVFFKLRFEDWVHHFLSCFVFAPTCAKFTSKGLSVFYFFCTGFPGAVDYTVLSLVKDGRMAKKRQKQIASSLNAYIRMPGGVFCAGLLFKDGLNIYSTNIAGLELILISIMIYANSCFYGKQAMENYGMYKK